MGYLLNILISVIVLVGVSADNADYNNNVTQWTPTGTDLLKRHLLKNYDKFARPAEFNQTTNCSLGMTILHIEVDEARSIMTVHAFVKMMWHDPKLRWDPAAYSGVSVLHVGQHEIWQPDVVLYNNAGANHAYGGHTSLLVYNSGDVLWVPPAQLSVFCELDMTYWPYDTQNCSLKFGSWTHHGLSLALDLSDSPHEIEQMIENPEWKVINASSRKEDKIYSCCEESYPTVTFSIQIERRPATYSSVVFTPATVIVLMILVAFWLPAASGEKVVVNGIVAIIISMFMLYFAHQLPLIAFRTPLIVKFYTHSLVLVACSFIVSTIVLCCAKSSHTRAVPKILKNLTDGCLGKLLLLRHQRKTNQENFNLAPEAEDGPSINQGSVTKSANQLDWIILGTAIDRLAFLIYVAIFSVMVIKYSV